MNFNSQAGVKAKDIMTANVQENASNEQPKQSDKEINFAMMRRRLDEESKARQEESRARLQAEERLKRLEEQLDAKNSKQDDDDDDDDDSEPYIDKKILARKMSAFEKSLDAKIDKKAEEKARSMMNEERQNSFMRDNKDFYEIMNPDMLAKFAETHPDVADSILAMPDGFERQKLVYKTIKSLGVHKKEEPKIQDTINKNRSNPGHYWTPQGSTPPYAGAGDFSPSGQKTAHAKMQELKNRLRLG